MTNELVNSWNLSGYESDNYREYEYEYQNKYDYINFEEDHYYDAYDDYEDYPLSIGDYLAKLPADTLEINISNKNLSCLPDLSRFTKLEVLDCSDNNIKEIILFNTTLQTLYCSCNQIDNFPSVSDNCKMVDCSNNNITIIPCLKNTTLEYLDCANNIILLIQGLNDTLQHLDCSHNNIKKLPQLPSNLQYLDCSYNKIISLPMLNTNLEKIYCSDNNITTLPNLNDNLEFLDCSYNNITTLPHIKDNVHTVYCCNNKIMTVYLHDYVYDFDFRENPLGDIIYTSKLIHIQKKNINTLYKFKYLFYTLKYKKQFRRWLWELVRERNAMRKYSPENLAILLDDVVDDEDELFHEKLNCW